MGCKFSKLFVQPNTKEGDEDLMSLSPSRAEELALEIAIKADEAEKQALAGIEGCRQKASENGMPPEVANLLGLKLKPVENLEQESSTSTLLADINPDECDWPKRLISFEDFIKQGQIPRSDHLVDHHLLEHIHEKGRNKFCIVFISHRWWSGLEPIPHPDKGTIKFHLLIRSLKLIQQALDEGTEMLLWIDYFGIDQDSTHNKIKGIKSLPYYIKNSDALLTPFTDTIYEAGEEHEDFPFPLMGTMPFLKRFRCLRDDPNEYFGRAWCRLEYYLGTNAQLPPDGYSFFKRRGLVRAGRPHFIAGDHGDGVPNILPPLTSQLLAQLEPTEGAVHDTQDLVHIRALVEGNPPKPEVPPAYWGERDAEGRPHGRGLEVDAHGGRYEGQYTHGLRHGHGALHMATGARYAGEWREGRGVGVGVLTWAHGGRYRGQYADGFAGLAVRVEADGTSRAGAFSTGVRHGPGVITDAAGTRWEGTWLKDKAEGPFTVRHAAGTAWGGTVGAVEDSNWAGGERAGPFVLARADGARVEGACDPAAAAARRKTVGKSSVMLSIREGEKVEDGNDVTVAAEGGEEQPIVEDLFTVTLADGTVTEKVEGLDAALAMLNGGGGGEKK